ncbi:MAG TPA: tetratricopeptide repeat protein [Blastocatellia bacterium]|nr:tetratricopeptide repeat protein [Blastocatellia bacterium]
MQHRARLQAAVLSVNRLLTRAVLFLAFFASTLYALIPSGSSSQPQSTSQISNAGYVEPGACMECHREIAESYARTAMARTFGAVRAGNDFPELKRGAFRHDASEEFFTVYARDSSPYLKRRQADFDGAVTNVSEARIDYWIGSGNHARSYINRTKAGELIELPITWYAENGGYWAMSPGYDRSDHAGFSRKINYRCMSCHNGYIQIQSQADAGEGSARFPERLPEGIDCQRCHGPGKAHVEVVRQGAPPERVRGAIINPARLSLDRKMEVCMQCHLETTSLKLPASLLRYGRGAFSYRPGEPLEDYILHFDRAPGSVRYRARERAVDPASNRSLTRAVPDQSEGEDRFEFTSAAYRLRMSACYIKSRGSLTCVGCHNPHEPSNTTAALRHYAEACQSCHQTTVRQLVEARRHPDSQDCASCHMPKRRPSDAIHTLVTDHFIQKRPAVDPTRWDRWDLWGGWGGQLVEKHDGNTPPYRGTVSLYYPTKLEETAENELYLAVAQVKSDANLDQGLGALEAAIARYSPSRSEFYFELAEAYQRAGNLQKAIVFYEQSCARSPADWRHFYRLGTTLTATGQPERAAAVLGRALGLAPKEPAVLEAIANLLSRQGKAREAVATLQAALDLDPESAGIYSNLGARLLQLNDMKGAERAWREAVRLRPEAATMRLNLANFLASAGGFQEAQHHFEAAIRSSPSFADAHLAYAIALAAHGDAAQSENQLREAIRYAPNHFEAHLRLGQALRDRGDASSAAPHLRKAAESPDARVRDAANKLLN